MGSSETLFSLEVAVECLRLHSGNVVCRFPAVAFRLLDFPTLLVHHIEPGDTQRIKDSVFIDQELNGIPLQLQELKDHRGNFVVKKGKSCMFKMNIGTLQSHLNNAPLYVMLVDTWPDVPKLVANCTVSLQEVIQNICEDIQNLGIEMPSVHGVRGSYKLTNLMGTEIGWIVLGLRLLSLGSSLMPHIPQTSLVMRRSAENKSDEHLNAGFVTKDKDSGSSKTSTKHVTNVKTNDIVVENLDVVPTGNSKPKLNIAISTTNENDLSKPLKNSATQTAKLKKKTRSQRLPPAQVPGHLQDLIVSNTHCPPPLFFNADLPVIDEDNPTTHQHDNRQVMTLPTMEEELNDSMISNKTSTSEMTTVSSQEQFVETHYRYQSVVSGERSVSVRKTHRKETSKYHLRSAPNVVRPSGDQEGDTAAPLSLNIHAHQMPILSALLQELTLLHGNVTPSVVNPGESSKDKVPTPQRTISSGKENVHVAADFTKPQKQSPYRHKHEDCVKTPRGVPAKKSWLRKDPKPSKPKQKAHKPKLRFGMTNSQKLRLQKNNPELLKHLQEQEAEVKSYRERLAEKVQRKKDEAAAMERLSSSEFDVSTAINHHGDDDDVMLYRVQSQDEGSGSDDKPATNVQDVYKRRRPIPTPRTPHARDGATFKWDDVHRLQQDDDYAQKSLENDLESKDIVSSSDKSVKSGRSLDVYLPTPAFEDSLDIDGRQSLHDSDSPSKSDLNYQSGLSDKDIAIPGFPSIESSALIDTGNSSFQYSDQFDTSKLLESTGERVMRDLSQSSYERSDDSLKDSKSYKSYSNSSKSDRSIKKDFDSHRKEEGSDLSHKHVAPRPDRLQPGFPMPKPLLSTKSPVPLAARRHMRPAQVQIPSNVQDIHDENRSPPKTPPTPKPRLHLQRTNSTRSSSSQPTGHLSTSEFSSRDSDRLYYSLSGSASHVSKSDHSKEEYSDEFESSDGN